MIGERLKLIRKAQAMNQSDFAKTLGLGQSTLAMMEVGKRTITDRHIKTICALCNINETWLRTGEGEMLAASADNIFDEFAQHYALTPEEQITARFLLRLSKDERATILHYIKTWAEEITAAEQ